MLKLASIISYILDFLNIPILILLLMNILKLVISNRNTDDKIANIKIIPSKLFKILIKVGYILLIFKILRFVDYLFYKRDFTMLSICSDINVLLGGFLIIYMSKLGCIIRKDGIMLLFNSIKWGQVTDYKWYDESRLNLKFKQKDIIENIDITINPNDKQTFSNILTKYIKLV